MRKAILLTAALIVSLTSVFAQGYKVGDNAIDFKLKNVDGKTVSLADYKKAKGFVVIFTCNHCPYAVAYEDRIIAIDKKYKEIGYPVIAINPNDVVKYPADSFENMVQRAQEKGFTFPYLLDETQQIAKTYGALKTPHVYVLQKEGKNLVVKYIGAIDDNSQDETAVKSTYLANALDELLADKPVLTPETKAIGCSIKWK